MRSLVVGRFQPPHIGHIRMLEYAASKSKYLIIGLGSCNKSGTLDNPFTAEEREEMLKESLNIKTPYEIKRIPDFGDNDKWIEWIKENIGFDVLFTNSENEKEIFTKAGFKVNPLPLVDRETYSATEVRERILGGGDWSSLLPTGTIKVLGRVDGRHRIRQLSK